MPLVDQVRRGIAKSIAVNPYDIVVMKKPLIDNGFGKMIPDINASPTPEKLGTASIKRRRRPEPLKTNSGTPYDYLSVYYLIADHEADWLQEGLKFKYHNVAYRTLKVEEKFKYGQMTHKVCDLEEITESDVQDIT